MVARHNPGFVGNARSVGTERDIVAAGLDHAQGLTFFLLKMSQKTQRSLPDEIFASGAQFVEHAPRHKHGRRDLRSGMAEFLPGALAVILEQADVLDARDRA